MHFRAQCQSFSLPTSWTWAQYQSLTISEADDLPSHAPESVTDTNLAAVL